MKTARRATQPLVWLVLSVVSAACMYFYVARIWSAGQPPHFSDLYAPWWGSHEFLLHNRNPYAIAVAHEIQSRIYGAPATGARPGDPAEIAGGFAYPLYSAFLMWPTIYMRFPAAQKFFVCLSVLATAGNMAAWFHLLRFRWPFLELLTMVFFTFATFPVLEGISLQNLSLVAAGILTLSLFLLAKKHLIAAGVMLAASTVKPQFTLLLVPWLAIWALSDWRRRQPLAWSFLASMVALLGTSEWLMPGWIPNFLRILRAYTHYTFGSSLLDVWFTRVGAPFAAAVLLLGVLAIYWPHRREPANSSSTLLTMSLILAATLVLIPTLAPHTQVLLLPGCLCLLRYKECLRPSPRWPRLAVFAVWSLLAWPWIAVLGMTIASLVFSPSALSPWWEVPLYTSPILPLAVAVALGFLIHGQKEISAADFDPFLQ
jgi:Glycosyltransferase family 87